MQFFNNNNYIPPNPIGGPSSEPAGYNHLGEPISSAGYNNMGGYYTNNYNYYNPYLEEEKKKQEQIHMKEQMRQQGDVMKAISMSASKCSNETVNESLMGELYDPVFEEDVSKEVKNQMMLLNTFYNIPENQTSSAIFEAQSKVYDYRQTLVPKDCTFNEFMDKSANLVDDIIRDEEKQRNTENLARLYNKDSYKSLVGVHKGDSSDYFNSMYDNNGPMNVSIDDLESNLPHYEEKSENVAARKDFMNRILIEIEKRNAGGYGV